MLCAMLCAMLKPRITWVVQGVQCSPYTRARENTFF
jgi:hypothetical protein